MPEYDKLISWHQSRQSHCIAMIWLDNSKAENPFYAMYSSDLLGTQLYPLQPSRYQSHFFPFFMLFSLGKYNKLLAFSKMIVCPIHVRVGMKSYTKAYILKTNIRAKIS